MTQLKQKTIIFDFDGTLVDSPKYLFEIYYTVAKQFGYDPTQFSLEEMRGLGLKTVVDRLKIPKLKLLRMILAVNHEIGKRLDQLQFVTGMEEVLIKLHQRGYRLGIMTSNQVKNVQAFLGMHDCNFFDFVYAGRDIFGKTKYLAKLIHRYQLNLEQTVYVGDEVRDIEACQRARLKIVAVSWGLNTKQALIEAEPQALVDSPADLLQALL